MKVTETGFAKGFIRMCTDGFYQGWHERNGGNLSYRLTDTEVSQITDDIDINAAEREIGTEVPLLAGEYFMVTGSGRYMRNVADAPDENTCIVKVSPDGAHYRIVWGLSKGGNPTSELPSHLMNLEVCKKRDDNIRVVYHCHPANIVALTFVLPLDGEIFTREIFEMETECPIVFPKGIGVVPWMVPGGRDIAVATSKIMETQDIAVWAHHGAFACGRDFDEAFGLMHTVEKAAEILVKVMSVTDRKRQTITPDDFRKLCKDFNVDVDERFLYEKKGDLIGER